MQVKKFEAPTIQEALEQVKSELGPEAVILQTKSNKKGFGKLGKASVEVTAAVSERSLSKKTKTESRLPESGRAVLKGLPAERQAGIIDKYIDRNLERAQQTQDQVQLRKRERDAESSPEAQAPKRITATRYIDIDEGSGPSASKEGYTAYSAVKKPTPEPEVKRPAPVSSGVEQELKDLKVMLEDLKRSQAETKVDLRPAAEEHRRDSVPSVSLDIPALQDIFEQLVVNGIDRRYALSLIKKASFELGDERSRQIDQVADVVASELMDTIKVLSPLDQLGLDKKTGRSKGAAVVSFIGPTGVGKTTTLAKIASEAQLKRQLKVGLINLDYYKITAFDQLATYGKILHVPFRSVASVADLKIALSDFQNLDLVLVDTTGRSHRDPQSLKEIQELLGAVPELMTFLVLSATTRDSELFDAASKFSAFRPKGLIISKLDEVIVYGGIYNLAQRVKLPFVYFTTGQKVPDDIETATRERLVALLLGF
jgi:flagellar biosynthesis protein FlhF